MDIHFSKSKVNCRDQQWTHTFKFPDEMWVSSFKFSVAVHIKHFH